jgi:hypothetical protein
MFDALGRKIEVSDDHQHSRPAHHLLLRTLFQDTEYEKLKTAQNFPSILPGTQIDAAIEVAGIRRRDLRACAPWLCTGWTCAGSAYLGITGELRATRKPRSLSRRNGSPLIRSADRQFAASLPQLPPRSTRNEPPRGPTGSLAITLG